MMKGLHDLLKKSNLLQNSVRISENSLFTHPHPCSSTFSEFFCGISKSSGVLQETKQQLKSCLISLWEADKTMCLLCIEKIYMNT